MLARKCMLGFRARLGDPVGQLLEEQLRQAHNPRLWVLQADVRCEAFKTRLRGSNFTLEFTLEFSRPSSKP